MQPPLKMVTDVFKAQLLASLIALGIIGIVAHQGFLSFFLGEGVMLIGNSFLAWRVYRQNNSLAPMPLVLGFLGGETGKYVILFLLTLLIAKTISLDWLFYVIGIATPQLLGIVFYLLSTHLRKSS